MLVEMQNGTVAKENNVEMPLKKLKAGLPYEPAILLLARDPKWLKSGFWIDVCTAMFIAALFTMVER